jgi:hypothetical protein
LVYASKRTNYGTQMGKISSWKLPELTKTKYVPEDDHADCHLELLDMIQSLDGRRLYLYLESELQCIDFQRGTNFWTVPHGGWQGAALWSYDPTRDKLVLRRGHRLCCIDGRTGDYESLPSAEIKKVATAKGVIFSLCKKEHVVRMWDAASGAQLRQLLGVEMALASKEGQLMIVGGDQYNGVTSVSLEGGAPQVSRGVAPFSQVALQDGCP